MFFQPTLTITKGIGGMHRILSRIQSFPVPYVSPQSGWLVVFLCFFFCVCVLVPLIFNSFSRNTKRVRRREDILGGSHLKETHPGGTKALSRRLGGRLLRQGSKSSRGQRQIFGHRLLRRDLADLGGAASPLAFRLALERRCATSGLRDAP